MGLSRARPDMLDSDAATILALLATVVVAFCLVALVPRVDGMTRSYRKFAALTTLGITYLVLLGLFMSILVGLEGEPAEVAVLAIGAAGFLLFGLTLLYDVADDWLRLFADPEFNTWVEGSLVLAVLVILVISFLAIEP